MIPRDRRFLLGLIALPWALSAAAGDSTAALLARDRALELPTPYVPPPGDPLEHPAAGFAQIVCSAAVPIHHR